MHGRMSRAFVAAGVAVGGVALAVGIGACSKSLPSGPGALQVVVRVAQAAPATGAVDIYDSVSGSSRKMVLSGLAAGQTDTLMTTAGTHWYDVTLTGQTGTISVPPQAGSVQMLTGYSYDVVVLDSGTSPSVFGQLLPVVMPDTISTNTKVRLVNGAEALGAVDLYLLSNGASFVGASPQFTGLAFPLNTSTGGQPLYYDATSGPTEIVVMPTGDTNQPDAYVDETVTFTANQAWTAVLAANPNGPPAGHLVLLRDR
jgi:hypothetical protein